MKSANLDFQTVNKHVEMEPNQKNPGNSKLKTVNPSYSNQNPGWKRPKL